MFEEIKGIAREIALFNKRALEEYRPIVEDIVESKDCSLTH